MNKIYNEISPAMAAALKYLEPFGSSGVSKSKITPEEMKHYHLSFRALATKKFIRIRTAVNDAKTRYIITGMGKKRLTEWETEQHDRLSN